MQARNKKLAILSGFRSCSFSLVLSLERKYVYAGGRICLRSHVAYTDVWVGRDSCSIDAESYGRMDRSVMFPIIVHGSWRPCKPRMMARHISAPPCGFRIPNPGLEGVLFIIEPRVPYGHGIPYGHDVHAILGQAGDADSDFLEAGSLAAQRGSISLTSISAFYIMETSPASLQIIGNNGVP